jgi:hypothetical protein
MYEPQKVSDLLEEHIIPNPCWVDPFLLPKGGLWLLGGLAKIGKSFITLELARALSTGTRPFDSHYFTVGEPARVLLCEQEIGRIGLQKRISDTIARHPVHQLSENFWILSKCPELQISTEEGRKILFNACKIVEPNVVILDPISKLHGYDENNNQEIEEMFRRLAQLRGEFEHTGMGMILTHHFRKPSKYENYDHLDPYNFAGSRKWFDSPDTITTVQRTKTLADKSGWIVRTRWELRHGEPLEEMDFIIKPKDLEGQVKFLSLAEDADQMPVKTKLPQPAVKTKSNFIFASGKDI